MAYRDDILALSPDHLWRFDGDALDSAGSLNATTVGTGSGTAACEDATNAVQTNGTGDRVTIPTSTDVDGALATKIVCGWIRLSAIQLPPKSIYREGTTSNQFCFVLWAGNNVMLDVVNGATVAQAIGDRVLTPGRDYHLTGFVEGTGGADVVTLYIDGLPQSRAGTLGAATLGARTAGEWGDPSGATEVGNATVLLNSPVNGNYNFWATFSSALTDTQIREELFEKGAIPDVTITNQAGLDALADTLRPDAPLCIRVDVSGDLTLTADNVTFDPLASIHVQYTGTGTLTWVNNNGSDASIGSTPNGGTLNIVTPATLSVTGLEAGSEVRFYEAGTTTELAGIESTSGTFSSSVQASSVDVRILALGFQNKSIDAVDMTGGDVSLVAGQLIDRQYGNA